MKLKDKVAIVTGASSGIGKETALLLAKEGATVFAVARRAERLKDMVEASKDFEGKIIAHPADMAKREDVEKMVDTAIEKCGKLDILVNNAGIMDDMAGVSEASLELYDKVMEVNVTAPFIAMQKAVKHFEANGGGVILNIASVGGIIGHAAGATYTASKHAIVGITKNTGFIYATKNIRCNCIAPGGVATEISQTEVMQNLNMNALQRLGLTHASSPRQAEPEEIARTALFLVSEDSSFVNGAIIVADGGWTA